FQGISWTTEERENRAGQKSLKGKEVTFTFFGASLVGDDRNSSFQNRTEEETELNVYSFWKLKNVLSGAETVMEIV
ncbi:MAG: hypothetical protein Q4C70_07590, partial [Planctomycetia bacterium]|nr:hypothetical protein [Planctomycetia bacterium]